MNERIKELIEQAMVQPDPIVGEYVSYTPPKEFSLEKFAELIVRECAGVSENHKGMNDKYFIADAIKKHFGVEE